MRVGWMIMAVAGLALAAQAEDPLPPDGLWHRTFSFGANQTTGNKEASAYNLGLLGERKSEASDSRLGVDVAYGETENEETANNGKAFAGYREIIEGRTYWLVDGSAVYDQIADVDYRVTAGPGLGYYLIKSDATTLGIEAGPSFISEKVAGVTDDIIAARVAERLEHAFSSDAKIWESVEVLQDFDDSDNIMVNAEIGAEAALNSHLSLRLVAKATHDGVPAPGREETDTSLIASLGVKF